MGKEQISVGINRVTSFLWRVDNKPSTTNKQTAGMIKMRKKQRPICHNAS